MPVQPPAVVTFQASAVPPAMIMAVLRLSLVPFVVRRAWIYSPLLIVARSVQSMRTDEQLAFAQTLISGEPSPLVSTLIWQTMPLICSMLDVIRVLWLWFGRSVKLKLSGIASAQVEDVITLQSDPSHSSRRSSVVL